MFFRKRQSVGGGGAHGCGLGCEGVVQRLSYLEERLGQMERRIFGRIGQGRAEGTNSLIPPLKEEENLLDSGEEWVSEKTRQLNNLTVKSWSKLSKEDRPRNALDQQKQLQSLASKVCEISSRVFSLKNTEQNQQLQAQISEILTDRQNSCQQRLRKVEQDHKKYTLENLSLRDEVRICYVRLDSVMRWVDSLGMGVQRRAGRGKSVGAGRGERQGGRLLV